MDKRYDYKLRASLIILPFIFIWPYIFIRSYSLNDRFWLIFSLVGFPITCWGILLNFYTRATITDDSIRVDSRKFMPPRQLNWPDIASVIDDVPPFLGRFPYMHKFNLIPKIKFGEPRKKWAILTAYFKDYKDLLKEVVFRVSPDTKVDASILKLTGLSGQDIGRLFKQEEVQ